MKQIPDGQVTLSLEDYHLLLDEPKETLAVADDFIGAAAKVDIGDLHAKWKKIFEDKNLKTRPFIKLEAAEAKELLTDILNLLK